MADVVCNVSLGGASVVKPCLDKARVVQVREVLHHGARGVPVADEFASCFLAPDLLFLGDLGNPVLM